MIAGLLHVAAWLVARLPRRALPSLGALFGFVAGKLARYRRTHVLAAMERGAIANPARTTNALYRHLGAGLAELLWVDGHAAHSSHLGAIGALAVLDAGARTALADAVERGPVVIFASHTGNWELAAAAAAEVLAAHGKRLFVVAKTQSVSAVDAFCMRLRRALGVNVIQPRGAFREAMTVLRRGDAVVLPIDQVPDRAEHAQTIPFLGAPALVDRAPAIIAHRAKATVLVAAMTRTDDGLTVSVLDTIAPREGRAWIDEATVRATKALELFVREHPTDWLWLHRRWKALPGKSESVQKTSGSRPLGFSENPG